MQEAWNNVEAQLKKMSFLLLESGVPERQVRMPVGRLPEDIKLEKYVEAFDWLHRLYTGGAWIAIVQAKALLPQEQWDRYEAYGFSGFQEQIILERAKVVLRKAWKQHRPRFFGQVYKEKENEETEQDLDNDDPESECVRSTEARTNESDFRRS